MTERNGSVLALDVGSKRIGLALASFVARLSSPYKTIPNDDNIWQTLRDICETESVTQLVVGLPRGLEGQSTAQTEYAETFAHMLATEVGLPIKLQDEAVTSRQAEAELAARGKQYEKGDIDALAAVYILDDYLNETR
ncbi:MAG: Holliday junction resolvase RuvX [Candidatus Saccharimonadales bacterium]